METVFYVDGLDDYFDNLQSAEEYAREHGKEFVEEGYVLENGDWVEEFIWNVR